MADPAFGAVVLAGGGGRRLGGADKPALVVGGRALLDIAVDACTDCGEIVVVGPQRPTGRVVRWTLEEPPGAGPLAALAAGLAALPDGVGTVAVLAADLPLVTSRTLARLRRSLEPSRFDAVLLTDADGRRQPLVAVYRRAALNAAFSAVGEVAGRPLHGVLSHLRIATIADSHAAQDIDTPDDLARWVSDTPRHRNGGVPDGHRKDHR